VGNVYSIQISDIVGYIQIFYIS